MPPPSPYNKALGLLAARPHFRRELERKLIQRGYPPEEIEEALTRLQSRGFLDDHATARQFVEARLERGAEGRSRLRAELAKRGAPEGAIDEALADLTADDDLPAAEEAAAAWERKGGSDPMALARHLDRKGFSRRAIVAVLKARPGSPELGEDES